MTGIGGWIGYSGTNEQCADWIRAMGERLTRYRHAPLKAAYGTSWAVAATGRHADLHQDAGLVVAVSGTPHFPDPALESRARQQGVAAVMAERFRQRGEAMLQDIEGAFALALLAPDSGDALIAVDRLGICPVVWQARGGSLVFASTGDAISAHPAASTELSPQALYNYCYFHMIPGPHTVYRDRMRLMPGERLLRSDGGVETRRYWTMRWAEGDRRPFEVLKTEFRQVLRNGVERAARGLEVGAFLSGGTDSSTVAGILGEVKGQPARTYSIGFDEPGYDEMDYARIAARHFGTRHNEYYVTPQDIVDAIPRIAEVHDQPFGNSSAVPTFYCARLARADGIELMLGGDGGDELFGGNKRYADQHLFALYQRVPAPLRHLALEPLVAALPGAGRLSLVRKAKGYVRQANIPMPARLESYNLLERFGPDRVFTRGFLERVDTAMPLAHLQHLWDEVQAHSLINRMLGLDLVTTLADNDLPKVSRSCELADMDVAYPMLDPEIVAFAARLAPRQKLKGTQLRWFFKEALRGFLPDEIIVKKKHGFGLPFGPWLRKHKPLQQLAADSLAGLKARGIIRPEFVDELTGHLLDQHAGYYGTMVWVLMLLEQWLRQRPGNH